MAKTAAPYVSIEQKIAEWTTRKNMLTEQFNTAAEDAKPSIQEALNEADRKIKWYEGRKGSAKFAAKAQAEAARASAVTEEPAAAPVATEPGTVELPDPTPAASVVNES